MKKHILNSGGTIHGLFKDVVIGDVVHGNKIEKGTLV